MELLKLIIKLIRYNIKVIFANKFIYFLLAALIFFIFIVTVSLFDNPDFNEDDIYYLLLFTGIILIFYPVIYGIQNDDDAKMLEVIFGIPNYRYKIWLFRFLIIILIAVFYLFLLASLANITLYRIVVAEMLMQLLFPITFLSALGFMVSTLIKNGNGTAIVMVIIGIIFLIFSEFIEDTSWNLFLNPFHIPNQMSANIWENVIFKNRLYLSIGSVISLLFALYNLQFREKFISS